MHRPRADQGAGRARGGSRRAIQKPAAAARMTAPHTQACERNPATITSFRGTLIIDAPDYVHRGVNGYPYWTGSTTAGRRGGRWVGIGGRTSNSQVDGIVNTPVQEPK